MWRFLEEGAPHFVFYNVRLDLYWTSPRPGGTPFPSSPPLLVLPAIPLADNGLLLSFEYSIFRCIADPNPRRLQSVVLNPLP